MIAVVGFSLLFVVWFTFYVVFDIGSSEPWIDRINEALIGAFGMVILGIICLGFAWVMGTGL